MMQLYMIDTIIIPPGYYDYAAATPILPEVLDVMRPYWSETFYNPSSLYGPALVTSEAVANARQLVAKICGTQSNKVIFTASGSESINLAILGYVRAWREENQDKIPHIITTAIEHSAVLESCRQLEREGFEVTYLPVDAEGFVVPDNLRESLQQNTALVSIGWVNNEIGTIQSIKQLARIIKKHNSNIVVHTDAVQAVNYLNINMQKLGVDMMTIDAAKFYGPKGIAALICGGDLNLKKDLYPIVFGGGQEKGLRAGTENVAGIVGLAKALEIAMRDREIEGLRISALRDELYKLLQQKYPDCVVNGPADMSLVSGQRIPNNINVGVSGLDSEFEVIRLAEQEGVMCSPGSACQNNGQSNYSHVIQALEDTEGALASSSLRFSLGKDLPCGT